MRIQIRFVRAWSHFKLAKKFEACIKTWYVRVPWKFFVSSFEAHKAAHFPKLRYDFSWFDRRERRRLRNRISGGKKRCLITSSSVNSMETQLRIRAAVYPLPPLSLSLLFSSSFHLVNYLDEHRVSNLETGSSLLGPRCSEGGVYPSS